MPGIHRVATCLLPMLLCIGAPLQAQGPTVPGERYQPGTIAASGILHKTHRPPTPDEPPQHRVELGGLSRPETDRLVQAAAATPLRIGIHRRLQGRPVDENGREGLTWRRAEDGTWSSTLHFGSRGAAGLRVALAIDYLPDGVEIYFRSADGQSWALGEIEDLDEEIWSPVILGDSLRLEISAPSAAAARELELSIPRLSHLVQTPWAGKVLDDVGRSGSCNRDLACYRRLRDIGASVAKYVFESGGFTSVCTGQLVADTDPDTTRFLFLTAAHCVSKRREARTMSFFWHFQRAQCEGADPTSVEQTFRGARLRFTTRQPTDFPFDTNDITLLELKRPPADGVTFSGWSLDPPEELIDKRVWGIHHPSGDVKMASKGKIRSLSGSFHFRVKWNRGTTEGGSSGSGIWIGSRFPEQYLVGVLTGGFASCESRRQPDYYGQFARAWNESAKLRGLLDPQ